MLAKVCKWTLLLCGASLLVNLLLYVATGNRDMLINLIGAAGLGILVLVGLWFASERR